MIKLCVDTGQGKLKCPSHNNKIFYLKTYGRMNVGTYCCNKLRNSAQPLLALIIVLIGHALHRLVQTVTFSMCI
jgi:hypothetical protein